MKFSRLLSVLLWPVIMQSVSAGEAEIPQREQFHLYLLIGQSNMAGRGVLETPLPAAPSRVLKLDKDSQWVPAVEPLHFDKPQIVGAGLGLTFAEAMAEANPDVTIGLIPCAVGGTPLSRWQKGGDLYQEAVERTTQAMKVGTLKGILWHQGEQDSLDLNLTESYADRLAEMVQDFRSELDTPTVPFLAGELGEFLTGSFQGKPAYPQRINEQIHLAQKRVPYFSVVSSSGLSSKKDQVHFDTPALREFGKRYAVAVKKHAAQASTPGWKAGTSRVKITPLQPMPMAGYAGRGAKHAEGTITDLWAKVLVLQDSQGQQSALITLDLVGIDRELSKVICTEIMKQQGWERSQIGLCTSHTHTGPAVGDTLAPMSILLFDEENQKRVRDYSDFLRKSIVQAVGQAVSNLEPADLAWGSGTATFAVNRRQNKEPDVPVLREKGELKGPNDHDVPVLSVRQNGTLTGLVFGYACHSTVLGLMQWSGDYAGAAQVELERKYPGCQAMFWAGCGGDQNPLPRRTVELMTEYGRQLASAVEQVVSGSMRPVKGQLRVSYQEVDLPLSTLPSKAQIEENLKSANQYEVARARYLLRKLADNASLSPTYPYPVSVWKLGDDVTFVMLGGEVVVDYALRLKAELGMESDPAGVWVAGYSHDVMAYIPSRRVLLEGGYEGGGSMVYYGLPTTWAPEIEEVIVRTVHTLFSTVASGPR